MCKLAELVAELVAAGADPNELQADFEDAVEATETWGRWGDGRWRPATVCSKCGSPYAGVCHDGEGGTLEGSLDENNLAFHMRQPGVSTIPLKEWLGKRETPDG